MVDGVYGSRSENCTGEFLSAEFRPQEHGMAVARERTMSKPRKKDNGAPQNAGTMSATIDRDACALRAYELYLARGRADGLDLDDWLSAERELRERTLQTQGQ